MFSHFFGFLIYGQNVCFSTVYRNNDNQTIDILGALQIDKNGHLRYNGVIKFAESEVVMSEMTPYFQSLERSADLACMVSETLRQNPGAKVQYHDQQYENDVIAGLDALADAIRGEAAPASPEARQSHTPEPRDAANYQRL